MNRLWINEIELYTPVVKKNQTTREQNYLLEVCRRRRRWVCDSSHYDWCVNKPNEIKLDHCSFEVSNGSARIHIKEDIKGALCAYVILKQFLLFNMY